MDDRDFEEEVSNLLLEKDEESHIPSNAYDYDEVYYGSPQSGNEDTSNIPDLPPVTMDDSELNEIIRNDDSATTNLSGTLQ